MLKPINGLVCLCVCVVCVYVCTCECECECEGVSVLEMLPHNVKENNISKSVHVPEEVC